MIFGDRHWLQPGRVSGVAHPIDRTLRLMRRREMEMSVRMVRYSTKISSTKIHAAPPAALCHSGHLP